MCSAMRAPVGFIPDVCGNKYENQRAYHKSSIHNHNAYEIYNYGNRKENAALLCLLSADSGLHPIPPLPPLSPP